MTTDQIGSEQADSLDVSSRGSVEFSVQISATREDGQPADPSAFRLLVYPQSMYEVHMMQELCKAHGFREISRPYGSLRKYRPGDELVEFEQDLVVSAGNFHIRYLRGGSEAVFVTAKVAIDDRDAAYDERQVSGDTSVLEMTPVESAPTDAERRSVPRG